MNMIWLHAPTTVLLNNAIIKSHSGRKKCNSKTWKILAPNLLVSALLFSNMHIFSNSALFLKKQPMKEVKHRRQTFWQPIECSSCVFNSSPLSPLLFLLVLRSSIPKKGVYLVVVLCAESVANFMVHLQAIFFQPSIFNQRAAANYSQAETRANSF